MGERKINIIATAYNLLVILLLSSLLFSYPLNSLCIIALLVVWLIEGGFRAKLRRLRQEPFFWLCAALFLLYLLSIGLSQDKTNARFFVEKNLSLIVLPLVLLSRPPFSARQIALTGKVFIAGTCLLMGIASLLAIRDFWLTGQTAVFFYHKLSTHVGISAIVASLFCIVSVAWLFYLPVFRGKWVLAVLLSIWLFFLSSKLFLFLLAILVLINTVKKISRKAGMLAISCCLVLVAALVLIPNPVKKRFGEMRRFQWSYLTSGSFNEGIYFDGLSLRVVFVRFGMEIVNERKAWLLGTGTGDAEALLQQKIRAYHMYTGDGVQDREGYLQYGYHNEFLQKYVQLGLLGLSVFLVLLGYCYRMAYRYRNRLLLQLLLIFTFTFFTDTLLEQQVGIVLFLTVACLAIGDIRSAKGEGELSAGINR